MASSVDVARIAQRRRAVFAAHNGGATFDQIAQSLGVSPSTVKKDFELARAEQGRIDEWRATIAPNRRER